MPKDVSEITIAIFAGTLLLVILGIFIVYFLLIYNKRNQQHHHEKEQLQSRFQQELLKSHLEIKEQTLQNISQEIHDNIGQVLSLVKLNLGNINTIQQPHLLQQKIEDSRNLVSKAIHDLRYLSKSMNTDYVTDMGLLRAVEHEVEMIQKSGAFMIELQVQGEPVRAEAHIELILFRIVQEVINNIIRHSKATHIFVQVCYSHEAFAVTITDNGNGFDLTPLNHHEHSQFGLGIRNMHTRASLVGATFNMVSTIGEGTTATIHMPMPSGNQPLI
jgi:two-component system, NarL family, sensor kinase